MLTLLLACTDRSPDASPTATTAEDTGAAAWTGETGLTVTTDPECTEHWFRDGDLDGFGDPATDRITCRPRPGLVPRGGDCDDGDPDLTGPIGPVTWAEISDEAGVTAAGPAWNGSRTCWRGPLAGGAAVADFDGDGAPDVFLTRTGSPDQLLINDGVGGFVVEELPGGPTMSNGALAFDAEGDGDLDVFVTSIGDARDQLWINDGQGQFREEGRERGLAALPDTGCRDHFGASAADVDRDGDLDLLVAGWEEELRLNSRERSRLLRNDGTGRFADATVASGLDATWDRAVLDPIFVDLDGDHDQDLLAVADWNGTSRFFNDGAGRFVEAPLDDVFTDENGMGADLADVDADGDLDLFVTSVWSEPLAGCPSNPAATCDGNRLYAANGDGFRDATDLAGVREGQWGWGTAFLDYDLDGAPDLALTGGMDNVLFRTEPGRLYHNLGDGRFEDETCTATWIDRGQGRGLVPFDADGDGVLELLVTGREETPSLWTLSGVSGPFLQIELRQTGKNPFGVGSRIRTVDARGVVRVGAVHANAAYVSSRGPWWHTGLGAADGPVDVEVTWPDGGVTTHADVGPGRVELRR